MSRHVTEPDPQDPTFATTSTRLPAASPNVPRSASAFLAIMAGLVVIKLLVERFTPNDFASPSQAHVFAWWFIAALTAVGLIGVWFASRTGFPETWDPTIPVRDRVWIPALAGAILGVIALAVDAGTGWTALAAAQMHMKTIHIAFPGSLLIYPGGAVIVNVIYYLVLIPPLTWLFSWVPALLARDRARRTTVTIENAFIVAALLAALIEPLTQDLGLPGHPGIMAAVFTSDLALNLALVTTFRRAGFGSTVVLRVVFYLVWHIARGVLPG
jgi:hypothetical protein